MAAILQDPNPIHYDVDLVRELGMGDAPVNQGPINLAFLMNVVTRWGGGPASLQAHQAALSGQRLRRRARRVHRDGDLRRTARPASPRSRSSAHSDGRPVLGGTAWVTLS